MQFPESWLRALVNPPLSTDELCHLLTMAGLEVEERRPAAADFSSVVVARILTAEKHPDADKLRLCSVDTGEHGVLAIVCGAPNAAAGMLVPCALVGAKLPGLEIKKAKVRGIESFGMLCSARELGLSEDHGGLLPLPADAPIGQDVRRYLNLDDTLITLKLTPNRADCLSLSGIAREVAALTGAPLTLPVVAAVASAHDATRAVVLDAPAACPRYCGRIVRGVDARAATPDWMKQRIERCGIRPISALVDITNYVMLELGQPLHAFDDVQLSGAIHVRYPTAGEQLLLLNEQTVTPGADTALIADEAKALAMAGIMGGEHSGINDATTDLFLESAFFTPDAIAGKARTLGFSSDASYRYERGVDFELQRVAIERATQLILDICGGHPGPVVEAVATSHLPRRDTVRLRSSRAAKVLGIALTPTQIESLLSGLGLACVRDQDGDGDFIVTPPSRRFDIAIEEDLIEELARLHGYDNIPAPPPKAHMAMLPQTESSRMPRDVRQLLADLGYHEVVNFSFVESAWERDFCDNVAPITLANPITSQASVMRSSLIGGLVGNLVANRSRQVDRVRVFEIGRCFRNAATGGPVPGFDQPLRVAGLCAATALPEQWGTTGRPVDFFDVKADVEALLAPAGLRFEKVQHPALHPGRAATVSRDGVVIGVVGELHPRWVQKYELGAAPIVFELELAALLACSLPSYREISRFPAVTRDIALVVGQEQPVQPILDALMSKAATIVRGVELFDVYQGKGLADGKKSLAFRIVMQDTQRTLSDGEVEAAVVELVATAQSAFYAELRK
ncbi:MAG: phenylalanine--tRNA ligase subunit beta [Gammaproteobacteria bacterium]|nr:phenylalanine--tRNA ligase subunit beta [Gammaproteobacteria bacterium]MBU1645476.1 phenylalanine--tRNA ligase subunit beta [Gammaproteobacteria bacterium]MBU1971099.1 phenylalanine--tRNA ligase subunit beta [Gammaproteobacteria bacterium]